VKEDSGANGETERDIGGQTPREERERMKGEIERNIILFRVLPCFVEPGRAGEEGEEKKGRRGHRRGVFHRRKRRELLRFREGGRNFVTFGALNAIAHQNMFVCTYVCIYVCI
jgi:hypothetical protein